MKSGATRAAGVFQEPLPYSNGAMRIYPETCTGSGGEPRLFPQEVQRGPETGCYGVCMAQMGPRPLFVVFLGFAGEKFYFPLPDTKMPGFNKKREQIPVSCGVSPPALFQIAPFGILGWQKLIHWQQQFHLLGFGPVMPRRHLPALNFEATVSANTARQDKIEIHVEHGSITDDPGDIANFLRFLGCGRIFTLPRRGVPPFPPQQIRRRATRNQPLSSPLFGGRLRVHNTPESYSVWRLSSLLSLNATRFVRHQQHPSTAARMLREAPRFSYQQYRQEALDSCEDEFALIEDDNWIPDDREWSIYAAPRFWTRHLESCLTGAVAEVDNDLHCAAGNAAVRIGRAPENPFNLYTAETYWEFFSDDPLGTVKSLQPMFERFAASVVEVGNFSVETEVEREPEDVENSKCLTIQTRVGERLKIYAKTNRRIRFEVTHLLSSSRPFRLSDGRHTFPTIADALPLLRNLASIAAGRVNSLLRHFRLNASASDEHHTVLKFIHDVQLAFDDPDKAFQLLQILASNGSLVVGHGIPLGKIFREELVRLEDREILQKSNRKYSVTLPYQQALTNMQQTGVGFLLGCRIRRKPNASNQP